VGLDSLDLEDDGPEAVRAAVHRDAGLIEPLEVAVEPEGLHDLVDVVPGPVTESLGHLPILLDVELLAVLVEAACAGGCTFHLRLIEDLAGLTTSEHRDLQSARLFNHVATATERAANVF